MSSRSYQLEAGRSQALGELRQSDDSKFDFHFFV